MEDHYQSKSVKGGFARFARVFLYASVLVAAFTLVLPFTQQLSQMAEKRTVRSVDIALPPPPPPPPEPPPPAEEKTEPPKPELKSQPKPMSLSQLQLAMNPGMGDSLGGAFGMGSFDLDTNALGDIQTFSIAELDEKPRLLRQPQWTWPRHAIGRVKADVKGVAVVILTERGTVEFKSFRSLNEPIIEADLVKYIESMRYSNPKKDGKPARARFILPLEFAKP